MRSILERCVPAQAARAARPPSRAPGAVCRARRRRLRDGGDRRCDVVGSLGFAAAADRRGGNAGLRRRRACRSAPVDLLRASFDTPSTGTAGIRSVSPAIGSERSARRAAGRSCSDSSRRPTRTARRGRRSATHARAPGESSTARATRQRASSYERRGRTATGPRRHRRHRPRSRPRPVAEDGGRTPRTAHRPIPTSGPGCSTCPTSPSSTPTATGSTAPSRSPSSSSRPAWIRTPVRGLPKQTIQAGVVAAALAGKDVYVASGDYGRVETVSGVDICGGYLPTTWARNVGARTRIVGRPEAVLASGDSVVLRLDDARRA